MGFCPPNKIYVWAFVLLLKNQCVGFCPVGFCPTFLGASLDGIIEYTDDGKKLKGVLEIKCPASN